METRIERLVGTLGTTFRRPSARRYWPRRWALEAKAEEAKAERERTLHAARELQAGMDTSAKSLEDIKALAGSADVDDTARVRAAVSSIVDSITIRKDKGIEVRFMAGFTRTIFAPKFRQTKPGMGRF